MLLVTVTVEYVNNNECVVDFISLLKEQLSFSSLLIEELGHRSVSDKNYSNLNSGITLLICLLKINFIQEQIYCILLLLENITNLLLNEDNCWKADI